MNTMKVAVVIPTWCRWMAIDESGTCYAFQDKPVLMRKGWDVRGFSASRLLYRGKPPKDFKQELYEYK